MADNVEWTLIMGNVTQQGREALVAWVHQMPLDQLRGATARASLHNVDDYDKPPLVKILKVELI